MNAPSRIYYTIRIDSGTLRGVVIHQSMTFSDDRHAAAFARIGRKVRAHGYGPAYTIVDASFQNYIR